VGKIFGNHKFYHYKF